MQHFFVKIGFQPSAPLQTHIHIYTYYRENVTILLQNCQIVELLNNRTCF